MIVYDLQCHAQHRFEGWFKDGADFESQLSAGMLSCPLCGSQDVVRVPAATHIQVASAGGERTRQRLDALRTESEQMLRKLHEHIDKHYENVGPGFAEEARRMHYGESEKRNIRGTASSQEYVALREEGIETVPVPPKPIDKDDLN